MDDKSLYRDRPQAIRAIFKKYLLLHHTLQGGCSGFRSMTWKLSMSQERKYHCLMHCLESAHTQGTQLKGLSCLSMNSTYIWMPVQIKNKTSKVFFLLSIVITQGWPNTRSECPSHLYAYWNYRDESTVADGIILKGRRILIQKSLQQQFHYAHQGAEKCKLLYLCFGPTWTTT